MRSPTLCVGANLTQSALTGMHPRSVAEEFAESPLTRSQNP